MILDTLAANVWRVGKKKTKKQKQNKTETNDHPSYLNLRLPVHLNHLNPKNDQHLISPYINTVESFIMIVRIKEMIVNLRSFDFYTNSPCQYQRKCVEKSLENMHADVRV